MLHLMPKVNVYLPDELAADVQRLGIQLSSICQRALREEVLRMATMQSVGEEQVARAVERLRLSANVEGETNWSQGKRSGRQWALQTAKHGELENLDDTFPAGELVHQDRCLQIAKDIDYHDVEAWPTLYFWLEDTNPKLNWLAGFVDGALEVWDEVRDLIAQTEA